MTKLVSNLQNPTHFCHNTTRTNNTSCVVEKPHGFSNLCVFSCEILADSILFIIFATQK